MGYAMRTDRYRLVVWKDRRFKDGEPLYLELYDHEADPMETINIAPDAPELVEELMQQFEAGWKGNLPKG